MIEEIKSYYDNLAHTYDANRFDNWYGKYIDIQERIFFEKKFTFR